MRITKLRAGSGITAAMAVFALIVVPLSRAAGSDRIPGAQCRWSLRFQTRIEQPGAEKPVAIALTGDWISTVSAVRPGEYDVAIELAGARIGGDSIPNNSSDAVLQIDRRLARPFWATYRDDGALTAVHFFKDVDPNDRNLLQMVASEAQLVRSIPGQAVWTAIERDGGGSYLAIYNRDDRGIVKRKLRYVQADGQSGLPSVGLNVEIDRSELHFALDAEGEIAALDADNRVRIAIPLSEGGQLVTTTETHLVNLRESHAPEMIGSLARAGADVVSSPIVTHQTDPVKLRARQDDQLLDDRSTESLLVAATAKSAADPWLSERLAALFRRRPEAVPAAVALLRQSGPIARITIALASSESGAAVEALAGLARDSSLPNAVRVDILAAFVRVHRPNPETMRMGAALLADSSPAAVRSAAYLASGALARAGRSEHRAEADAIDAALIERYANARETSEITGLLAGFGNTVGPSVLPVIEQALRDPRPAVRAAAARGLRLSDAPEVDGLLAATIAGDADADVRSAAIFAASFRVPTVTIGEALQRAARDDSADAVRSKAVSLLRQQPNAFPGVLDTLAWVGEHDTRPGVRRLAQEGLASLSK